MGNTGALISLLIKAKKLKQKEVAASSDLSPVAISRFLSGTSDCYVGTFQKLLKACNVNLDSILTKEINSALSSEGSNEIGQVVSELYGLMAKSKRKRLIRDLAGYVESSRTITDKEYFVSKLKNL